jgi:hypothetical protein
MSNEDVLSLNLLDTRETITVDGVEYPVVKLEISRTSQPFTQEKTNLSILQDVLTSSKLNTLNTLNNFNCFNTLKPSLSEAFFFIYLKTL